jgi:hypothetical protein
MSQVYRTLRVVLSEEGVNEEAQSEHAEGPVRLN